MLYGSYKTNFEAMALSSAERKDCFKIISLCGLWYLISSTNNIVGKVVLNYFPYPMTLSIVQLLSITVYSEPALKCLGVRQYLGFTRSYLWKMIIPLSLGKFLAVVFAHISISKVPLSYAHTVKATMPLFTVIFGRVLLHQKQTLPVYVSLFPIIVGVALATVTELSFDVLGLASALASTALFAVMQLFSKKVMIDSGIHHLRLLHVLGRLAFLMFLPIWMMFDLSRLLTESHALWDGRGAETLLLLALDGFLSWLQNIVAFTMLHLVSPLTYAVCNATKRISIITASLLLLRNPVSMSNVAGMLLALGGVLLYNRAKYNEHRRRSLLPVLAPAANPLLRDASTTAVSIDWADKLRPVYGLGHAPSTTHTPLHQSPPPGSGKRTTALLNGMAHSRSLLVS